MGDSPKRKRPVSLQDVLQIFLIISCFPGF
nr:MAG TPA: hypothetical protein [Caudoviricetes sp.]